MEAPVVLELGSHRTKIGIAGQVRPTLAMPTAVGLPKLPHELPMKDIGVCPLQESEKLDHTSVVPLFTGMSPDDWRINEEVLLTLIANSGRNAECEVQWQGASLLWVEPSWNVRDFREAMAEILFEQCEVECVLPQRQSVLSTFACARTSALVADFGSSGVTISAVIEGSVCRSSLRFHKMGGQLLSKVAAAKLRSEGLSVPPLYTLKEGAAARQHPFVEDDYVAWASQATLDALLFSRERPELPDGTKIQESLKPINTPAVLFDPMGAGLGKQIWMPPELADLLPRKSLMATVWKAMEPPEVAGIHDVVNSVITTGGLTARLALVDDFRAAMAEFQQAHVAAGKSPDYFGGLPSIRQPQWALGNKQPTQWGWRCIYPKAAEERTATCWIGGSILGSLGVFRSVATTRASYMEHGKGVFAKEVA